MAELEEAIRSLIEQAGWSGPLLFILLHLLRPFLFLPVVAVCIAGGYLFGFIEGTFYTKSYREYMHYSVVGVVMPSVVYAAFGEVIEDLACYASAAFFAFLTVMYALLEKRNKKYR